LAWVAFTRSRNAEAAGNQLKQALQVNPGSKTALEALDGLQRRAPKKFRTRYLERLVQEKIEQVDKPNPVPGNPRLKNLLGAVIPLDQELPLSSSILPGCLAARVTPSSLFGFAPCGFARLFITKQPVRSYRTFSPLPKSSGE